MIDMKKFIALAADPVPKISEALEKARLDRKANVNYVVMNRYTFLALAENLGHPNLDVLNDHAATDEVSRMLMAAWRVNLDLRDNDETVENFCIYCFEDGTIPFGRLKLEIVDDSEPRTFITEIH